MGKPTPTYCEPYCMCPACYGPGRDEWVAQGKPTYCTDGKVHLMGVEGCPVVEDKNDGKV